MCDSAQEDYVISSDEKCLFVDIKSQFVKDFEELYKSRGIKSVIYSDEDHSFYFLCNEFNGATGLFLFKFEH